MENSGSNSVSVKDMIKIFNSDKTIFVPSSAFKLVEENQAVALSSDEDSFEEPPTPPENNLYEEIFDDANFARHLNTPEVVDEVRNFITEEENFCLALTDLMENYINKLETDKFDDIMDVFGRVDLISSYQNNTFFPDLKSCKNVSEMADCFIKHKKLFNTYYDDFFRNQQNMILLLNENKETFKADLHQQAYKEYELFLFKTLNARIKAYYDFLELMRKSLSDHGDVTNFERAIEIVEELTKCFTQQGKNLNIRFVISEIVETERVYIEKLEKITEQIIPKIQKVIKGKSKQRSVIGNLPAIYPKQLEFYETLKQCLYEFEPNEVSTCFLQHRDLFSLYVEDQKLKNDPDTLLECKETLQNIQERNFDCYATLNRLYKYKLLLQELQKCCTKAELPCDVIEKACDMITETVSKINAVAAINCIRDENLYLDDQGDLLLRDQFVVNSKSVQYEGMIFLFEKAIIFTEIVTEGPDRNRRDAFIYHNHIIVKYLALTITVDSPVMFKVAFYGRGQKIVHKLRAKDQQTKDAWVASIKAILTKQFQEEKMRNS